MEHNCFYCLLSCRYCLQQIPCRWGVLFPSGMLLIYVVNVVVNINPWIVNIVYKVVDIVLINDLLFLIIFVAITDGVFLYKTYLCEQLIPLSRSFLRFYLRV